MTSPDRDVTIADPDSEVDVEQTHEMAPPLGAMLVRLAADGPDWIDRLRPVPPGNVITVSVSDPALRSVPAHRLLETGYRIVGQHRAAGLSRPSVDLLVHADLAAAHMDWWRAVLEVADAAFDLRMGPVQLALGSELALHLGLA